MCDFKDKLCFCSFLIDIESHFLHTTPMRWLTNNNNTPFICRCSGPPLSNSRTIVAHQPRSLASPALVGVPSMAEAGSRSAAEAQRRRPGHSLLSAPPPKTNWRCVKPPSRLWVVVTGGQRDKLQRLLSEPGHG